MPYYSIAGIAVYSAGTSLLQALNRLHYGFSGLPDRNKTFRGFEYVIILLQHLNMMQNI
jgi:hypothetical protein